MNVFNYKYWTAILVGAVIGATAHAQALNCNLRSDTSAAAVPSMQKPGYLQPYRDPVFGTKITRVTGDPGTAISSGGTWGDDVHHQYSTIQAFNADQSLLFIETNRSGQPGVFLDGNTYQPVVSASCPVSECLWHPTNPNIMITISSNALGTWNPRTGARTTIATFSGYSGLLIGHDKGNLSRDGSLVALDGYNSSGVYVAFIYDIVNKVKYADIDFAKFGTNGSTPRISAAGKFLTLGYSTDVSTTYVLDLNGNYLRQFPTGVPDHGDLTIDANGDDVEIGSARGSGYNGQIVSVRLRDGKITPIGLAGGYGSHTSGRALKPWGVSSFFSDSSQFASEIHVMNLDGSKVYRVAQDHNPFPDYEAETHPTLSPDGMRVVFASAWGGSNSRPVSVYVIDLRDVCSSSTSAPAPADTTAPSVPTNLAASAASTSQINLSWSGSSDATGVTGYTVYRGGVAIANVTGTSYSNTGLSAATSYSYAVLAYDAAGNKSAQSAAASATTQSVQPAPAPAPAPSPSGNLIVNNPGFDGNLNGWTIWANSSIVTTGIYEGSSSLKVAGQSGLYQAVKVSPGQSYTMSFASMISVAGDSTGEIGIEFFNSSGAVIYDKHLSPSAATWTKSSFTFTAPSSFSSALVYVYKNSSSANLFADSMSLLPASTSAPAPAPAPAVNLITGNPGFDGNLSGWNIWANCSVVTSSVYAGSSSLKVAGQSGLYQAVKVSPGQSYTMSFASMISVAGDSTAEIGIEFFDSAGNVIFDKHLSPSAATWTKSSFTFTAPSSFSSALVYVYKNSSSANLFADSMSLTTP